ncbi:hypothetical protein BP6252_00464 [Coleophoma cylindrospora]|uniref:Uncharacterized protein n=1 Tax=Coleophoma cylindrospora TaxID=1849047 RepID=A0A3D8SQ63_9HELO|nr:hypothetical protein BP6252_00464 [Coleophoma cylindrospora]
MGFLNLKGQKPDTQSTENSSYAQELPHKSKETHDDLKMDKKVDSKAEDGYELDLDDADVRFQLMFGDIKDPTAAELKEMDNFASCGPNLQKNLLMKKGIIKGPQKGRFQKMLEFLEPSLVIPNPS